MSGIRASEYTEAMRLYDEATDTISSLLALLEDEGANQGVINDTYTAFGYLRAASRYLRIDQKEDR